MDGKATQRNGLAKKTTGWTYLYRSNNGPRSVLVVAGILRRARAFVVAARLERAVARAPSRLNIVVVVRAALSGAVARA